MAEQTLAEIWNGGRFQALRAEMYEGGRPERFCDPALCPHLHTDKWYDLEDKGLLLRDELREEMLRRETRLSRLPVTVRIANDFRCNLRCRMCSSASMPQEESFSALETLKKLEPDLGGISYLEILGSGEALAIPELREYLSAFDSGRYPGLRFILVTNGLLFTPATWEKIKRLKIYVVDVSIDAASAAVYEHIRRGGSWKTLMRNLAFLAEKQKEGGLEHLHINMTVMRSNCHEIAAFARLGVELGADLTYFHWIHSYESELILEGRDWRSLSIIHEQLQDPVMRHPSINASALFNWPRWIRDMEKERENRDSIMERIVLLDRQTASERKTSFVDFTVQDARERIGHFHVQILGRAATLEDLDLWCERVRTVLAHGIDGRYVLQEVAWRLLSSQEYAHRERTDEEFVLDCYRGLLMRHPQDPEAAGWLTTQPIDRGVAAWTFLMSDEFLHVRHVTFRGFREDPFRNLVAWMEMSLGGQCWDCRWLGIRALRLARARDSDPLREELLSLGCRLLKQRSSASEAESSESIVIRLWRAFTRRFPTSEEMRYWTNWLDSGSGSPRDATAVLINSAEFRKHLEIAGVIPVSA